MKKSRYHVMATVKLEVYVPINADSLIEALEKAEKIRAQDLWDKSDELLDADSELTGVFEE